MSSGAEFYSTQGRFSDPGLMGPWLDDTPKDLAAIRDAASTLVFHYMAAGDITTHGFPEARRAEINLRYADAMLARLHELNPAAPGAERQPLDRVVGCCRDYTLLFVTMARHHGIPARARVGFATYLRPGWASDHVVAEVWDAAENRWRLVEPQFADGYVDPGDGAPVDLLDVPRDRFLVGPDAWAACRSGALDPERCIVAPELPQPFLRSWAYLVHNLVFDLAALHKDEMILWDLWGPLGRGGPKPHEIAERLDELAAVLLGQHGAAGRPVVPDTFADLRVPVVVTSVTPPDFTPDRVTLRGTELSTVD
jgi:hypothetical protein